MIGGGRGGALGLPLPRAGRLRRGSRRAVRLPRPGLKIVLAALLTVLVLGGAWLWLRDSSLVAVRHVTVLGDRGPDQAQIRSALIRAAHSMTTLDVREDQFRTAVAPYPVVKDVKVTTHFPHGLTLHVIEQIPVGAVAVDGREIAVAGDGTLLRDTPTTGLATIPLRAPPGGNHLRDPTAQSALAVLAAAPYPMLGRIGQVVSDNAHGPVAELRSGPSIRFGDTSALGAKWSAATAVLADPGSAGASYLDVSDPQRPAAGAGQGQAGIAATAGSGAAAAASSASNVASGAGQAGATVTGG